MRASKKKVYSVTVLPGDGIGPEVMAATQKILEATGVRFHWDVFPFGKATALTKGRGSKKDRVRIPKEIVDSIKKNGAHLKARQQRRSAKGIEALMSSSETPLSCTRMSALFKACTASKRVSLMCP